MRFILNLALGLFFALSFQACTFNDLDDDATLSGKITDFSGNGLAEAKVKIAFISGEQEVLTSADGTYFMQFSNKGSGKVTVSKSGYKGVVIKKAFVAGGNETADAALETALSNIIFEVDLKSKTVDYTANSLLVNITTNVDYTIDAESTAYWVRFDKAKDKLTIRIEENPFNKQRSARITLETIGGEVQREIVITQKANPSGL